MQYFTNDGLLHGTLRTGKNLREYRERFKAAFYFNELNISLNPETYQPEIVLDGRWTREVPAHLSWHNQIKSTIYFDAWHSIKNEFGIFSDPNAQQKWPTLFSIGARERAELQYDHNKNHSGVSYYGTKIWKAVLESDFVDQMPMIFPDYDEGDYRGY